MTRELRWRILSLQVIVTLVLAFAAGVGYWANSYTHDQVGTQIKEQQIVFPPANSKAITTLPASSADAMKQYAGQAMTTGYQAHTYAENFIAVHLKEIGQGKTYGYFSGKALAEQKTNPKQFVIDEGIANTLFKGETLRSLLNQGYAFWFIGDIAFWAAAGFTIGAMVVFLAFLFELLIVPKREGVVALKSIAAKQAMTA
jgi:hypothetical protein